MDERTSTTTSWYADNHLEEVDDAWTTDDPDAYRQAMPWRPRSMVLAESERTGKDAREADDRLARARGEDAAGEDAAEESGADEVLAAYEIDDELAEAVITEVEGVLAADIFGDELVDIEELEDELSAEEVVDLASALAADIRDALASDLGHDAVSPLDEPTDVDAVDLRSVDLQPLDLVPLDPALDEPTEPIASLVLVPGYSVQCEPAANTPVTSVLDRATPARIARRLWQRDIDRVAG